MQNPKAPLRDSEFAGHSWGPRICTFLQSPQMTQTQVVLKLHSEKHKCVIYVHILVYSNLRAETKFLHKPVCNPESFFFIIQYLNQYLKNNQYSINA